MYVVCGFVKSRCVKLSHEFLYGAVSHQGVSCLRVSWLFPFCSNGPQVWAVVYSMVGTLLSHFDTPLARVVESNDRIFSIFLFLNLIVLGDTSDKILTSTVQRNSCWHYEITILVALMNSLVWSLRSPSGVISLSLSCLRCRNLRQRPCMHWA